MRNLKPQPHACELGSTCRGRVAILVVAFLEMVGASEPLPEFTQGLCWRTQTLLLAVGRGSRCPQGSQGPAPPPGPEGRCVMALLDPGRGAGGTGRGEEAVPRVCAGVGVMDEP